MKQVTALNLWLQGLHKIILTSGYVALVAVVAGADVKVKNMDLSFTETLPSLKNKTPASVHIQQCSVKNMKANFHSHENANSCQHDEELNKKIFDRTLDNTLSGPIFKVQKHNHKEV